MIFNYIDNLIILVCADAECDSVYVFAPLVGIDIATVELTTCVIAAGIKEYKSVIKKKREKCLKVVFWRTKLIATEVLVSTILINSKLSMKNLFKWNK